MKIKTTTTEIECTAEEIRQSNTLAEAISTTLRGLFNGVVLDDDEEEENVSE